MNDLVIMDCPSVLVRPLDDMVVVVVFETVEAFLSLVLAIVVAAVVVVLVGS